MFLISLLYSKFDMKVKVKVTQSCLTLCDPKTIQSMEFSRQKYWSAEPFPSPGYLPNPGIKPRSPTLQADSLPAEPQGKPKKTAVGSLSLLQRIFPTQESNPGLLHCRRILYHLSHPEAHAHTQRQRQTTPRESGDPGWASSGWRG